MIATGKTLQVTDGGSLPRHEFVAEPVKPIRFDTIFDRLAGMRAEAAA